MRFVRTIVVGVAALEGFFVITSGVGAADPVELCRVWLAADEDPELAVVATDTDDPEPCLVWPALEEEVIEPLRLC